MRMNGRGGRPPLCPGEESIPVTVKWPQSEYDLLYKLARVLNISIPEFIRRMPAMVCRLQAELDQCRRQLDELIDHCSERATPEESTRTLFRLLAAEVETNSTKEAAVLRFIERWPTDPHTPGIRRTLEKFRATTPGLLTDDDLWLIIKHGNRWREMKELFKEP